MLRTRAQVEILAEAVQKATGESVELAHVDRGYTGEEYEWLPQTVAGLHIVAFACLFFSTERSPCSDRVHNSL